VTSQLVGWVSARARSVGLYIVLYHRPFSPFPLLRSFSPFPSSSLFLSSLSPLLLSLLLFLLSLCPSLFALLPSFPLPFLLGSSAQPAHTPAQRREQRKSPSVPIRIGILSHFKYNVYLSDGLGIASRLSPLGQRSALGERRKEKGERRERKVSHYKYIVYLSSGLGLAQLSPALHPAPGDTEVPGVSL
jgi:hypothetical protein